MTSLTFEEADHNELFNRIIRAAKFGHPRRFGLFHISDGESKLVLYRDLPPTRGMKTVMSHDYESGMVLINNEPYAQEALEILRREQVLDDMADIE